MRHPPCELCSGSRRQLHRSDTSFFFTWVCSLGYCPWLSITHIWSVSFRRSKLDVAWHLDRHHVPGQSNNLKHADKCEGQVELPPAMALRAGPRCSVMVVVPAFAVGEEGDEPVVPAAVAC